MKDSSLSQGKSLKINRTPMNLIGETFTSITPERARQEPYSAPTIFPVPGAEIRLGDVRRWQIEDASPVIQQAPKTTGAHPEWKVTADKKVPLASVNKLVNALKDDPELRSKLKESYPGNWNTIKIELKRNGTFEVKVSEADLSLSITSEPGAIRKFTDSLNKVEAKKTSNSPTSGITALMNNVFEQKKLILAHWPARVNYSTNSLWKIQQIISLENGNKEDIQIFNKLLKVAPKAAENKVGLLESIREAIKRNPRDALIACRELLTNKSNSKYTDEFCNFISEGTVACMPHSHYRNAEARLEKQVSQYMKKAFCDDLSERNKNLALAWDSVISLAAVAAFTEQPESWQSLRRGFEIYIEPLRKEFSARFIEAVKQNNISQAFVIMEEGLNFLESLGNYFPLLQDAAPFKKYMGEECCAGNIPAQEQENLRILGVPSILALGAQTKIQRHLLGQIIQANKPESNQRNQLKDLLQSLPAALRYLNNEKNSDHDKMNALGFIQDLILLKFSPDNDARNLFRIAISGQNGRTEEQLLKSFLETNIDSTSIKERDSSTKRFLGKTAPQLIRYSLSNLERQRQNMSEQGWIDAYDLMRCIKNFNPDFINHELELELTQKAFDIFPTQGETREEIEALGRLKILTIEDPIEAKKIDKAISSLAEDIEGYGDEICTRTRKAFSKRDSEALEEWQSDSITLSDWIKIWEDYSLGSQFKSLKERIEIISNEAQILSEKMTSKATA